MSREITEPLIWNPGWVGEESTEKRRSARRARTVPPISIQPELRLDNGVPDDWSSQMLYTGDGAANWIDVVSENQYNLNRCSDPYFVEQYAKLALLRAAPAVLASLGPGDGKLDSDLLEFYAESEPRLAYVPVDISRDLLLTATSAQSSRTPVPLAILSDWESGLPYIHATLSSIQGPKAISMLGGSIGNLPLLRMKSFLTSWRNAMGESDRLILDVPLRGPKWTSASEARLHPESFSPAFRRFVCGAIAQACSEDVNVVLGAFDERVVATLVEQGAQTSTIKIFDSVSKRVALHLVRHNWLQFLEGCGEIGFDISMANATYSPCATFGMGVVLLVPRK